MLIVFDTNIWKSNLYLRSPTASAVKAYLKIHGAEVCLPEVIELEVKHHLLKDIKKLRDRIKGDHDRLLGLFRQLREVVLPTNEEIEVLVENSVDAVGLPLVRVSFEEKAARGSFLRTTDKRRPSNKNQQFKDGVLWENCKTLSQNCEVILVTDDRAFYQHDEIDRASQKNYWMRSTKKD